MQVGTLPYNTHCAPWCYSGLMKTETARLLCWGPALQTRHHGAGSLRCWGAPVMQVTAVSRHSGTGVFHKAAYEVQLQVTAGECGVGRVAGLGGRPVFARVAYGCCCLTLL
jgi:hypothetical protein